MDDLSRGMSAVAQRLSEALAENEKLRGALAMSREYVESASTRWYDGTNGQGIREEAARRLAVIDAALGAVAAPAPQQWGPAFDVMSPKQEELVKQFCAEIAGPRGKKGSPPDPVRLLEMAQGCRESRCGDEL